MSTGATACYRVGAVGAVLLAQASRLHEIATACY